MCVKYLKFGLELSMCSASEQHHGQKVLSRPLAWQIGQTQQKQRKSGGNNQRYRKLMTGVDAVMM
jgi:hypothetical protein